ncbi:MAG TPA: TonB-dependent receptor [Steroidobacteraceae bacterium]|nr:TonB-dependent receptor [Steroidobacteraceae bacterium]
MTTNLFLRRAVRCTLFTSAAAALAGALPAQAQQQESSTIQEVVVTGSRIAQPGLTSVSPVTSVSADTVKIEGVTRVEDLLNNMPQAFADFGGNLSNGSTGTASVNLRNLGSQRTLVLVNSRRLMPGDPTQNAAASPDLNQIPAALIERVEVLTGGASAVYGADAVAGVVNFIMNDKFEGVRLDAQYSMYQHNNSDDTIANVVRQAGFALPESNVTDGYTKDMTFIAGINTPDGKGNATVYLGYRTMDAITQNRRDFSACALASSDAGDPTSKAFNCGGSGTTSPALFQTYNPADPFDFNATGAFTVGANGAIRDFDPATDLYNFAPSNYYQRPDERKTGGLFAHYDMSDKATVYTEFMFMDDRTTAQIAPSGAFIGGGPGQPPFFGRYAVNCDNPLLTPSAVSAFCGGNTGAGDVLLDIGRRNTEGGGRIDDLRHTSFRGVLGLRGDFAEGWNYDVYGLYGTSVLSENFQNDLSRSRLRNALQAVAGPGGTPVCRINADADLTNDDPNCVPYSIFGAGPVTPAQLAYLQVPGLSEGETVEQILSGSVSGDLGQYGIKLPTANDGLGVAFGAEYRSERSELRTDLAFQTNDLAGQGAPTLNTFGSFDVKEVFAEARLPILQDKPFADTLSLEAGYRYSDYNLGFNTDSYKAGLQWAPVQDVMLRGSYQRAVRSPNIQELFLQPRVQLDGNTDPCANDLGATPTATFDQCARTGVTAAQYGNILANPAAQYNGNVGGNRNILPEESDTYSFGFVLTPSFAPGLSFTVDYYDISVDKLINSLGADFILGQCLDTGDPTFCNRVHRAGNGSLWLGDQGFVDDPILNTGSLQSRGIDTEVNYRFDMGNIGSLGLQFIGTYVDEFLTEPLPGAHKYDCAGLYGTVCGTPVPDWRHKLRASWTTPINVDLSLTWRYIAAVDDDRTSSDPSLTADVIQTDKHLGSRSYFDLTGSYNAGEFGPFASVNARLGINNVLDKDPPLVGQDTCPAVFCNGNTFPQVYDTLGRYVFLGLTADF